MVNDRLIPVRMPKELYAQVQEYAVKRETSASVIIRKAIRCYLSRRKCTIKPATTDISNVRNP